MSLYESEPEYESTPEQIWDEGVDCPGCGNPLCPGNCPPMVEREISERCDAEGHEEYENSGRCYCGARIGL